MNKSTRLAECKSEILKMRSTGHDRQAIWTACVEEYGVACTHQAMKEMEE